MDVSSNIKAIRNAKGIAQAEIARRLDLDPSSYHRLENRGSKLSIEQAESISKALGVTLLELLTWGENREGENNNKSQALTRIEELEDRLRDKNKLIEKLEKVENELDRLKSDFEDYIWDSINNEAIKTQVGEVELHYGTPAKVKTIPMDVYVKSLRNEGDVDETYHTYGISLTDLQVKEIFFKLLDIEVFREFVSNSRRMGVIQDDTLNRLYETYTNVRYRLPKRNA